MKPYREELREVLSRLAAPAMNQIEYLKAIGTYPSADELALEFHELIVLAEVKLQAGELNDAEQSAMFELNSALDGMSGQEHCRLWNAEALVAADEWTEVRKQAKACLALIDSSRA